MPTLCATVDFEPIGKRVQVEPGATLLEAARLAGVPLTSDCGGAGTCGQCRVVAREAGPALSPPNATEQARLAADELAAGCRLACQARVLGDVKVDLPPSSLRVGQRLQLEGGIRTAPAGEAVLRAIALTVPPATLADPRGDLDRVLDTLAAEHGLAGLRAAPAAVRTLPALLRAHTWQATVLVRGSEIIGFLPPTAHPLGLAVDLGTTKVAAYLVDLATGQTLAADGRPNPQIGYGEDVISRLAYAARPGGARELAQAVHHTLAELVATLAAQAGVDAAHLAEACIVGNTAMTHLLLELPTAQLAAAPYVPAAAAPQEVRCADLGLPALGDARLYVGPCVAGFVGADHVAMILSAGLDRAERTALGIDIGTNTEIVLARRGQARLASLSCASGPAFEGAHIRAGMRAALGAIERVEIDKGCARVQTVGGAPAAGICGSGILDAVAELRRAGAINARGRLQPGAAGVRAGRDGLEFLLVPAGETATGSDISLCQHDIDEIQMAKGAIQAGIAVLLEATGTRLEELDEVVLAGAFGCYLNIESAVAIGMLPRLPLSRFRQVGNAAGDGARQMLASHTTRARAAEIARRIDYIELTIYPGFRRHYAQALLL